MASYKGPPSLALTEHWNYADEGKDFFGGYASGRRATAALWEERNRRKRGLWGDRSDRGDEALQPSGRAQDRRRNHAAGTQSGERSPTSGTSTACRSPASPFPLCDNDKGLIRHALGFMRQALEATDARDIWDETDDTAHLNGTARMGNDPGDQRRQRRLPVVGHSEPSSATARCFRRSAASIRR